MPACSDALVARQGRSDPDRQTAAKCKEVVLADRIEELGFGWYQIQVWILSSGFIIAEGAEVQMASGLVHAMQEEFNVVTHLGKAMLMTWTFIGFTLGTMASGPLGDSFGRRNPMILGYCGVVITAACTTMAMNVYMLYGFRLIMGFFAGIGIPVACITISEVFPSAHRGMATAGLGIAYVLGELWAASGLMMLMPDLVHGSWRLLIAWSTIPAVSLFLCGMLSPVTKYDTPFFLASRGKTEELRDVLNLMAETNNKPQLKLADDDAVICQVPEKIAFAKVLPTLLRPPLISKVCILSFMMFAKDFACFGSGVFWPQLWARIDGLDKVNPGQELVVTAALGIPGVLLAVLLMKVLPRKTGIVFCASACSMSAVLLRGLSSGKTSGFLGVLGFKLLFPTWQMTTMLLPSELFGTQIRGWGFSCAASIGRLATVVSPFAVELGTQGFSGLLSLLALGAALAVLLLPETKDCELVEDAINDAPSQSRRHLLKDGQGSFYGAAEATKV